MERNFYPQKMYSTPYSEYITRWSQYPLPFSSSWDIPCLLVRRLLQLIDVCNWCSSCLLVYIYHFCLGFQNWQQHRLELSESYRSLKYYLRSIVYLRKGHKHVYTMVIRKKCCQFENDQLWIFFLKYWCIWHEGNLATWHSAVIAWSAPPHSKPRLGECSIRGGCQGMYITFAFAMWIRRSPLWLWNLGEISIEI